MGTSFHGFAELYQAKTPFWIVSWILILLCAFSLTVYQVNNAIQVYIEEPTQTRIKPGKENEILYPPIRFCFMTWLLWVDWKKASDLHISKEVLLYGLSFINSVFSSVEFDFNATKISFDQMMVDNKFCTLFDFYKAISRDVPLKGDNEVEKYFDEIDIVLRDKGYIFCFKISSKQIQNYFNRNRYLMDIGSAGKVITFTSTDESYAQVADHVTPQEYSQSMVRWVHQQSLYRIWPNLTSEVLLTNFSPPILVYANAYDPKALSVFFENDDYSLNLDATSTTVKTYPTRPCLEGERTFADDDHCQIKCLAVYQKTTCSCLLLQQAFILNDNDTANICRKEFFFIVNSSVTKSVVFGDKSFDGQKCKPTQKDTLQYEECKKNCIAPCTTWNYDITTSFTRMALAVRYISTKASTNISIKYPAATDIIVMTEEDAMTFDGFVSSVGGLLGIWTGASIVSFIQFVYLFCCANCTRGKSWFSVILKRSAAIVTDVDVKKTQVEIKDSGHILSS